MLAILEILEKLPPYGRLFLAPEDGCSLRLQRWGPSGPTIGPSGPPKNVQNSFGKFCRNPFGKCCKNFQKSCSANSFQ